jgi:DNA-binding response OmpR family regulator
VDFSPQDGYAIQHDRHIPTVRGEGYRFVK